MTELEILQQIEQTSGTNDKKTILKDNINNERLFQLFDAAFNFFKKYHIKKFEVSTINPDVTEDKHCDLLNICKVLQERVVTGNDAKELVENFLNSCNPLQQKWYSRVIKKDLGIGVSISSANSCGFNIPKFDVMLAKDAKKMKKAPQVVEQGVLVSPKLDGYRCLMVWDGEEVNLYSRNGSHYENFSELHSTLTSLLSQGFHPMVLDGEIMSDDFQSMQKSAFASVRGTTVGDMVYHVFGYIPYEEWVSDNFSMTTKDRFNFLRLMFDQYTIPELTSGLVQLVPQKYTKDWDEILQLEAEYLKQGLEGAMALPADMPYYKGRKTNALMKFKTFHTMDCVIEEFYEGTGKYENLLGGVKVKQEDGTTICGVGSGFTDEDRNFIWNNQKLVKGRIAEVRYQELTEDGVMRFPTFVRWRDQGLNQGKI